MNDGRKTTSIARRIAWHFQWRSFWRAIWQTALLGVAAAAGWCFAVWRAAGSVGGKWSILTSGERAVVTGENVRAALRGQNVFAGNVIFRVGDFQADMGDFLFWLILALIGVFVLRLLLWTLSSLGATRRVRRYLRPIDDIALVTESISSRGFDESRFHSLEEAIDHINGVSADEQLHIGDDDLSGLETAVNNLIVRMHNGYRRQVQFVDDASHELRTPIAVIQGYADMLDRWGKQDPQVLEESIRAIRTETEHMKTLVEQLLFLARGDAGRQNLDMRELDIAALLREVWEESGMIDPDHEYILKAEEGLRGVADEAMLKQAVRILIENAAKYSEAGTRITLRAYGEAGGKYCIDVQDNGIGVSENDARRMFDRFYRADAARNSQTGGSGLGLAIARWIVGRHGGAFRVRSYEGIGTCITIVLPREGARAALR